MNIDHLHLEDMIIGASGFWFCLLSKYWPVMFDQAAKQFL